VGPNEIDLRFRRPLPVPSTSYPYCLRRYRRCLSDRVVACACRQSECRVAFTHSWRATANQSPPLPVVPIRSVRSPRGLSHRRRPPCCRACGWKLETSSRSPKRQSRSSPRWDRESEHPVGVDPGIDGAGVEEFLPLGSVARNVHLKEGFSEAAVFVRADLDWNRAAAWTVTANSSPGR